MLCDTTYNYEGTFFNCRISLVRYQVRVVLTTDFVDPVSHSRRHYYFLNFFVVFSIRSYNINFLPIQNKAQEMCFPFEFNMRLQFQHLELQDFFK